MITQATKIKRGSIYILNGNHIFVWKDREDGTIVVSDTKTFENTWVVNLDDLKPLNKGRSTISNKPKVLTPEEIAVKKELNVFFASQLLVCPTQCEECGTPFFNYNKDELRGLIAHILPKNKKAFPSVACHPQNRMFLGTKCGCHNFFDNLGAEERSKMNIYKIAIERFQIFKNLLTPKELIKAKRYLNIKD